MINSKVVQIEEGKFLYVNSISMVKIKLAQEQTGLYLHITLLYGGGHSILIKYPIAPLEYVLSFSGIEISSDSLLLPEIEHCKGGTGVNRRGWYKFDTSKGEEFIRKVNLRIVFDAVMIYLTTHTLQFYYATTLFMFLLNRFDSHSESKEWLMSTIKGYIEALNPKGEING